MAFSNSATPSEFILQPSPAPSKLLTKFAVSILPSECSIKLELDIKLSPTLNPPIEAETNLAKPSELIVDKNGPAAGVFIVFALKSPNIVALVPITTDPVITPLPSKKKFDDVKAPSDFTLNSALIVLSFL